MQPALDAFITEKFIVDPVNAIHKTTFKRVIVARVTDRITSETRSFVFDDYESYLDFVEKNIL